MPAAEQQLLWKTVLAQIEVKLDSPAIYKTFFSGARLVNIGESQATIAVPNPFTSDWLKQKYTKLITDTISHVYGNSVEPQFIVQQDLTQQSQLSTPLLPLSSESPAASIDTLLQTAGLNPRYTMSSFIIGDANRIAHAAASAVIGSPGTIYNPLYIFGPSGVGKTHLAQAVGRSILERSPNKKIVYTASEGFMNDMVKAIKSNKNREFRNKYRSADILIIDDVQQISKWEATRGEIFNTFNELHNNNSQVILIADRRPEDIKDIEDRLKTRFQGGMVVDITKPDFELRLAILERKAVSMGAQLSRTVLEMMAREITESIRELEGALQKVSLFNQMKPEGDLSLEEVARIMGTDSYAKREKVKVPDVIKCVAQTLNVKIKDIKGPRRTKDVAMARQICMYVLREELGYKLEEIATLLDRQDHTTVMHAVDKVKSMLLTDSNFKAQLQQIVGTLGQDIQN
ncbi:MAG: chromosomal replication initiator protein DnaA [Candidatus Doudnabacteria bacterium]|nr:chromosomal replication initiator protein DnaA [Candidatus Doudnabacteria bacterium]